MRRSSYASFGIGIVAEKSTQARNLIWLMDSLDRLAGFPTEVRQKLGFALYQAQIGQQHESAKSNVGGLRRAKRP